MKKTTLGAMLLFTAVFAFAYQWPVDQKTVVATFGQNFAGGFHNGIDLAGGGQDVRPLDAGVILYYQVEKQDPRDLPSGIGSFVVVQHEKKLRSLYGHMNLVSEIVSDKMTSCSATDVLGKSGEGGYSEGARLHLAAFDTELNQVVNPYLLLPPLEEKIRPTVRNVTLKNKEKSIQLPDAGPVSDGSWAVSADVFDQSSAVRYFCPMAPYKISVFLNGQETFKATFDALKEKDGAIRLYPSADVTYSMLYEGDLTMKLGTIQLNRGLANLEIIVKDFAGNERIQSFQFRVN